jgi:hypothetical protein
MALSLALGPVAPAPAEAQEAPPTNVLPTLPPEVTGATTAVSPVVWQACRATGLAIGATIVAGTLLGVPPDVGVPLNAAVAALTGPVLGLFFELCQQVPLPDDPPDCATDQQVPPLPSLGRPILPAGLLASELRALDASLTRAGLPFAGALGDLADDLLDCAAGRNPEPDAEVTEDGAGAAPARDTEPPADRPALDSGASVDGLPAPVLEGGAPAAPATGEPLPSVAVAGVSDPDTATGVVAALVALGALAAAGWIHAGSGRRRRLSTDPGR